MLTCAFNFIFLYKLLWLYIDHYQIGEIVESFLHVTSAQYNVVSLNACVQMLTCHTHCACCNCTAFSFAYVLFYTNSRCNKATDIQGRSQTLSKLGVFRVFPIIKITMVGQVHMHHMHLLRSECKDKPA